MNFNARRRDSREAEPEKLYSTTIHHALILAFDREYSLLSRSDQCITQSAVREIIKTTGLSPRNAGIRFRNEIGGVWKLRAWLNQ